MAPEKVKSIILKAMPYRESSYILHLFSDNHGLIHGIAKGIRRKSSTQQFLERGFIVEHLAYLKAHRELHTLGSLQVREFFPLIRESLVKSTLRDAAFELVLMAITVSEQHPELFAMFERFLVHCEEMPDSSANPFLLWRFYAEFCAMTGFEIDFHQCITCAQRIGDFENACLNIGRGAMECERCSRGRHESTRLSPVIRKFLQKETGAEELRSTVSTPETRKVTRLLADYCRYHFNIRGEFKALEFLAGLTK